MFFFTADEHYGHKNIIDYCHRPYDSIEEMDEELIHRHNLVVGNYDKVVHVGDFAWGKSLPDHIITRLKGKHIFIEGSHDKWFQHINAKNYETLSDRLWEKKIEGQHVVACHYPMVVWPRSHYAAFHVFGHVHGRMFTKDDGIVDKDSLITAYVAESLSFDVGVDPNDFYPVSFEVLKTLMVEKAEYILEHGVDLLDCYKKSLESLVGYE